MTRLWYDAETRDEVNTVLVVDNRPDAIAAQDRIRKNLYLREIGARAKRSKMATSQSGIVGMLRHQVHWKS